MDIIKEFKTEEGSSWSDDEKQKKIVDADIEVIKNFESFSDFSWEKMTEEAKGANSAIKVMNGNLDLNEDLKDEGVEPRRIYAAILDLAWRARLEDAEGRHKIIDKIVEILEEKKDMRLGFVFAVTVLNVVFGLEERNWELNHEKSLEVNNIDDDRVGEINKFVVLPPATWRQQKFDEAVDLERMELDRKISVGFRGKLVKMITEYLEGLVVDGSNDKKVDLIVNDIKKINEVVLGRALLSMVGKSVEEVESERDSEETVGEGYLDLKNLEEIYNAIGRLKIREVENKDGSTTIDAQLDDFLQHSKELEGIGLKI